MTDDLIARLREKLATGTWDAQAHNDWTAVLDRAERAEAERDSLRGLLAAVMRNVTAMPVQLARRIDAALAKGEE